MNLPARPGLWASVHARASLAYLKTYTPPAEAPLNSALPVVGPHIRSRACVEAARHRFQDAAIACSILAGEREPATIHLEDGSLRKMAAEYMSEFKDVADPAALENAWRAVESLADAALEELQDAIKLANELHDVTVDTVERMFLAGNLSPGAAVQSGYMSELMASKVPADGVADAPVVFSAQKNAFGQHVSADCRHSGARWLVACRQAKSQSIEDEQILANEFAAAEIRMKRQARTKAIQQALRGQA